MSAINSFAEYEDAAVFGSVLAELMRQQNQIELIASENIVSSAVLAAQGSIFTNKYAGGSPGQRSYAGCEYVDVIEDIALERAKGLFGCAHVNVQPHSGAQANAAVLAALLEPDDTILGMAFDAGGALTREAKQTCARFKTAAYGTRDDGRIDYAEVERIAHQQRPRLIVAGGPALPRQINFGRFRSIADSVGATLMVDMSHFAGLVAGDVYPSPFPHAHVVTSTTHKTLRGPRGGIILTNDSELAKKINSAVIAELQGSPFMHVIAAKAVAFAEALRPSFQTYAKRMIESARALANALIARGFQLVTGGTDTHLVVVDLRGKGVSGEQAENILQRVGLTCNKNTVPSDHLSPLQANGIRLGTASGTTRGFGADEFARIGALIADMLEAAARFNGGAVDDALEKTVRGEVQALCKRFPIYERL